MLYALEDRSLYRLNPVAGAVWYALSQERCLDDLDASVLLAETNPADTDHPSLSAMLDELAAWGLIEFVDPVAT